MRACTAPPTPKTRTSGMMWPVSSSTRVNAIDDSSRLRAWALTTRVSGRITANTASAPTMIVSAPSGSMSTAAKIITASWSDWVVPVRITRIDVATLALCDATTSTSSD